jgi:protein-S-isoprenylcysteine O-methyltransferase
VALSIHQIIDYAWVAAAIIWLAAAFTTKRAVRKEFGRARLLQVLLLVAAFLLYFNSSFAPGFFAERVVPLSSAAEIIGLALTLAGLLFAGWARFFLGRNWSGSITIKEDHQLMQSGPYAIVRHPIYSGLLFALLGTAIAFGRLRNFLGLVLATIAWRLKSLVEERYMTEQFGAEYTNYKRRVKALVPFIW